MRTGRPAGSGIKQTARGWSVQVPACTGSKARKQWTFATRQAAVARLAEARQILAAGGSVKDLPATVVVASKAPSTRSSSSRPTHTGGPTPKIQLKADFREVAADAMDSRYNRLRKGSPGTRDRAISDIRIHIQPWMDRMGFRSGEDLTYDACEDLMTAWAYGSSTSSDARSGKRGRGRPTNGKGCAAGTLRMRRRTLIAVLEHGAARYGWKLPFDTAQIPIPSIEASPARTLLTLSDCRRIARHLHPVHQLVLWLVRILGLRLGEAFGVLLSDVELIGDRGTIHISKQGGQIYQVRNADGTEARVTSKLQLKTRDSERTLVLPHHLASFFRNYLEVFHPFHAMPGHEHDRLVRGLRHNDTGGVQAFQSAFRRAAEAERISIGRSDAGIEKSIRPTPKDGRAGAFTDLQIQDADPVWSRRAAGHRAGADVHAVHYLRDDPRNAPMQAIAKAWETGIDSEIPGSLCVPTSKSCTTRMQPALWAERVHIDSTLVAMRWLVPAGEGDGETISTAEAAQILQVEPKRVRKLIDTNELEAKRSAGKRAEHRVDLASVLELRQMQLSHSTLSRAAKAIGISRKRAWVLVGRLQLKVVQRAPGATVYLPPVSVKVLKEHVAHERAIKLRSVTFAEAAEKLDLGSLLVEDLVSQGLLEVDPEIGPQNARMITRKSLERCHMKLRS